MRIKVYTWSNGDQWEIENAETDERIACRVYQTPSSLMGAPRQGEIGNAFFLLRQQLQQEKTGGTSGARGAPQGTSDFWGRYVGEVADDDPNLRYLIARATEVNP